MKYFIRSTNPGGHKIGLQCGSLKELQAVWKELSNAPWAVACSDGSAGTSRWLLSDSGTWVVGSFGMTLQVDSHQHVTPVLKPDFGA